MARVDAAPASARPSVSFGAALRVWARIGLLGFGGPAGQIALMHRMLVEERRWISERRFLHALNYCMLLPGPEAQQLATYVGWLLHGWRGGLAAGVLFVLPGFAAILGLSLVYAAWQEVALVEALFFGLKPVVVALVFDAVLRIGKRALGNGAMIAIAALAFAAIFFFAVPFPLIVLAAALIGFLGQHFAPRRFELRSAHAARQVAEEPAALIADGEQGGPAPSAGRTLRTALVGLALWWLPLGALALALGPRHVQVELGLFFSQAAVVTFGGAYAVLAYVAQQAVEVYGWLQPGEMLDGLGMAESTPGPLIQVVQFVGFMAAFREPGALHPLLAGVLGSLVVTWVTFAPCFLWIFLGAPWIEALRGNRWLSSALAAITAAVVGVILNLALWFALHVLFAALEVQRHYGLRVWVPELRSFDFGAAAIALAAFVALRRFKLGLLPTLGAGLALGALWYALSR